MRLDHLLSKEHHDVWVGPQVAVSGVSDGFVGWAASVVGVVRVRDKQSNRDGVFLVLPDTLLGFETTGLCPLWFGGWPRGGGVGVLLPCFGGGVWCLICG